MVHFTYQHDDNLDIHKFIFYAPSRLAVDEFVEHLIYMNEHLVDMPDEMVVKILLDIRESGIPPIRYMTARVSQFQKRLPKRLSSRTVIIYGDSTMLALISNVVMLMSRLSSDEIRFYHADAYDEALAWLAEVPDIVS